MHTSLFEYSTLRLAGGNHGRRGRMLSCLLVLGLTASAWGQPGPAIAPPDEDQRPVRERFEAAVETLPVFDVSDFLYARLTSLIFLTRPQAAAYEAALRTAGLWDAATNPRPAGYDVNDLLELLKHDDPRVRTLALAALGVANDPQQLPHMARLVGDQQATFPRAAHVAQVWGDQRPVPLEPQTVGEIARRILQFWQVPRPHDPKAFEDYWAQRQDRKQTVGWFEVRLRRAGGGIFPLQQNRQSAIQRVYWQIRRLPPIESEVTLLAVTSAHETPDFLEDEVLFAARRLGPERLLSMLRGDMLIDDPDVTFGERGRLDSEPVRRLREHILRRAARVLDAEHADSLEAAWRDHHGNDRSPWWAIALAELQPDRAGELIGEAWGQLRSRIDAFGRATLMVELWRIAGDEEADRVMEWFYRLSPTGGVPSNRIGLPEFLIKRWQPSDRRLLARLIADPRFETLGARDVQRLAYLLNRQTLEPVVAPEALRSLHHPLGLHGYDERHEQAMQKHLEQTRTVTETLSRWRAAIRAHAATWSAAGERPDRGADDDAESASAAAICLAGRIPVA